MALNVELLQATLARIEADPSQLDSNRWRGWGGGCCFAGHVVRELDAQYASDEVGEYNYSRVVLADGNFQHIEYFAQEQLRLSNDDAARLLHMNSMLGDLRVVVAELVVQDARA